MVLMQIAHASLAPKETENPISELKSSLKPQRKEMWYA